MRPARRLNHRCEIEPNFANLRELADRADVILRVSDALDEYGLGILIDGRLERRRVVRCDKLDPYPIFLEEHCASIML